MSDPVLYQRQEQIGLITLNKPKANQLSNEVFEFMDSILDRISEEDGLRAVVITGAGDKIFSAGADLSGGFGNYTPLEFLKRGQETWSRVETLGLPVVAAMNGHAFGGGLELAMACHFRILNRESRIGLTETNLGIIPGYGGTLRLPRYVGRARAIEMMAFGEQVPAEKAYEMGLVNRICDKEQVLEESLEYARKLAARPPLALRAILSLTAESPDLSMTEHLEKERESLVKLFETKDMMEGMTAFMQKRQPEFKGE